MSYAQPTPVVLVDSTSGNGYSAASAFSGSAPAVSITAASAPAAGSALVNPGARAAHTLQVDVTTTTAGTAGTHTVTLQGSLDGTNWTTLGTASPAASSTTGSNAVNHANVSVTGLPYTNVRANWTAIPTTWVGTLTATIASA